MLQVTLELCWAQLRTRHRDDPRFAIVAYGKLGGKELGYASDLDLIFLYDDADESAQETYARLAQRLSRWLTARTGGGRALRHRSAAAPAGRERARSSARSTPSAATSANRRGPGSTRRSRARASARATRRWARAFEEERIAILRMPRDEAKLREDVLSMREAAARRATPTRAACSTSSTTAAA